MSGGGGGGYVYCVHGLYLYIAEKHLGKKMFANFTVFGLSVNIFFVNLYVSKCFCAKFQCSHDS